MYIILMEPQTIEKVLKRLDILISLKLINKNWDNSPDQERIEFLDRFGLKPAEIAEILNSTGDKISKQLYAIKSRKGKHGGK